MIMRILLFVLGAAFFITTSTAAAQPLGPFAVNTRVTVALLDGERVEGRLLHLRSDRLYLWPEPVGYTPEAAAETRVIPFASVDAVDLPLGRRSMEGTAVTAMLLGVAAQTALVITVPEPTLGHAPNLAGTGLAAVVAMRSSLRPGSEFRVDGDAQRGTEFARRFRHLAAYPDAAPTELAALPLPEPVERAAPREA